MTRGYSCRVERHSIGPDDCGEAVTWVIRFPRRVLAEVVTHRANSDVWGDWDCYFTERTTTPEVSKNSASSRAIPFERMVKSVTEDPFIPQWTRNQKGMQGEPLDSPGSIELANALWRRALAKAIDYATELHNEGVHKQDCNRLLEPFAWVTQVVTGTMPALSNFFALRTHKAADPHFRTIARMMYLAYLDSTPARLNYGQWHLPFVPPKEEVLFYWRPELSDSGTIHGDMPRLIKHSAARCAWVSYENHDKDGSPEAMERTYDRLLAEVPVHASPVEHQLSPMHQTVRASHPHLISNCRRWLQARKLIPMERLETFSPPAEEVAEWREEVKQWYSKE